MWLALARGKGRGHEGKKEENIATHRQVECAYCRGRGRDTYKKRGIKDALTERSAYELKCMVCLGKGMVMVEEPARNCAFCGGKGISKRGSVSTCPVCRGKGMVTVKEPAKECPICHGMARKPGSALYCIRCRGLGSVSIGYAQTAS